MNDLSRFRRHQHARAHVERLGGRGARRLIGEVVQLVRQGFKDLVRLLRAGRVERSHEADREGCESGRQVVGGDVSIGHKEAPMDGIPQRYRPLVDVSRTKRSALNGEA